MSFFFFKCCTSYDNLPSLPEGGGHVPAGDGGSQSNSQRMFPMIATVYPALTPYSARGVAGASQRGALAPGMGTHRAAVGACYNQALRASSLREGAMPRGGGGEVISFIVM